MIGKALRDEIKFLREFRNRFDSRASYLLAIKDLYNQGLITRKAMSEVTNKPKKVKKPKKPASSDPCMRNIRWQTPCGSSPQATCSAPRSHC